MLVANVVGARPQFVKAAVVSRSLRVGRGVTEVLVHTGQHYDPALSARFFADLDIPQPDVDLGVGSAPHGAQTGQMLERLEGVLAERVPDWVIVYGDTNSTLAGALAAAKLRIPLAHVEAGLRSFNRAMPEEINRVVTDHVADVLFAPTEAAAAHLRREGIDAGRIDVSGDVMYDAALFYADKAASHSSVLADLDLTPEHYCLATVHRAETTDDPERLAAVLGALDALGADLPVVAPLHPRTSLAIERYGWSERFDWLQRVAPVGYLDMVELERHARLIATDSGGVQKEAFFHRTPCVTLRTETEWTELIDLGWNRLAPPHDADAVLAALRAALQAPPGREATPYGDGRAGDRIADVLLARAE